MPFIHATRPLGMAKLAQGVEGVIPGVCALVVLNRWAHVVVQPPSLLSRL